MVCVIAATDGVDGRRGEARQQAKHPSTGWCAISKRGQGRRQGEGAQVFDAMLRDANG